VDTVEGLGDAARRARECAVMGHAVTLVVFAPGLGARYETEATGVASEANPSRFRLCFG
jgi:hypothetical protein